MADLMASMRSHDAAQFYPRKETWSALVVVNRQILLRSFYSLFSSLNLSSLLSLLSSILSNFLSSLVCRQWQYNPNPKQSMLGRTPTRIGQACCILSTNAGWNRLRYPSLVSEEPHGRRVEPEPAHPSPGGGSGIQAKRKKRRRACLSCVRCHRLKIKCDKKEPCTRCRLSGWGRQCEYTHRVEPSGEAALPYVLTEEDPQVALATWHAPHRGLSHWRSLLSKASCLAPSVLFPFRTANHQT
ncbi:Transcription factor lepE [Metarhizium anisopliae]